MNDKFKLPLVPTDVDPVIDLMKEEQKHYIDTHDRLPAGFEDFASHPSAYAQDWATMYFLRCAYIAYLMMDKKGRL